MEQTDFDLEQVLSDLVNAVSLKARQKDLEFVVFSDTDVPRGLRGDPLRLGQVLLNLANNAVKFTERGEIVVSTQVIQRWKNRVDLRFSVRDTGIGLTADQKNRLFQSFYQGDASTTRKYGGTGLGLAICKKLVDMMAGKIGVESDVGQGSTFWFTARFDLQEDNERTERETPAELKGLSVLVVDDSSSARNALQERLVSYGCRVTEAGSGEEAVRLWERESPQLVLMDRDMPGMDGIEATRLMRESARGGDVRLVIRVMTSIDTLKADEEPAQETPIDQAQPGQQNPDLRRTIAAALKLLEEGDTEAAERIAALIGALDGQIAANKLSEVKSCMDRWEFDKTAAHLLDIAETLNIRVDKTG